MTINNKTIAISLRDKTISKQQALSRLNIPSTNYSRQQLRTGMQGRVQRRENRRFIQKKATQEKVYAKQRAVLDLYIARLNEIESRPVSGDFSIQTLSAPIAPVAPVPITSFWELPKLKRVR